MLVDDHAFVRTSLAQLLDLQDDFDVVAQCVDGDDAIGMADTVRPDVVVMDLNMPIMNGAVAAGRILKRNPRIAVIILTASPTSVLARQAIDAGARRCIPKDAPHSVIFDAIRGK
ncbi:MULTISPECIES: response regulator transcription factor [unclassified Pseudonocardia]|uniref:response regulator n=1 Tax=unclassified Pseudonocardia TaxID=2619320 RepID=UPI001AC3EF21|nr:MULTISPECIES: response regulator transcription factor [unclassified Pseudonocardia]MBN9098054.1 response regulator transcription factor [Pseudonocardia sp.]